MKTLNEQKYETSHRINYSSLTEKLVSEEEVSEIDSKISNWKNKGEYLLYKSINEANKFFPYSGFLSVLCQYLNAEHANLYLVSLEDDLMSIAKFGNKESEKMNHSTLPKYFIEEATISNSTVLFLPIRIEDETIGVLEIGSHYGFIEAEKELLISATKIITPKIVSHFLEKNYSRRKTA